VVNVSWKGDLSHAFSIRFPNEEIMKEWYSTINQQLKIFGPNRRSAQDFMSYEQFWKGNPSGLINPYAQRDDNSDDGSYQDIPVDTRQSTSRYSKITTPIPSPPAERRVMSPRFPDAVTPNVYIWPTQLKVRVNFDDTYMTLLVDFNITYQSLIERIDAKIARVSNNSISGGTMRLKYKDEDGDLIAMESDSEKRLAFQEWLESQNNQLHTELGELILFCSSVEV
jgi:cell division control protein 24